MKERDYYTTPKSNRVMRFLWKAAGGDRYLLEQATYSDQVKYMCLGGIVFATGAMAGLAGGYGFYTIFSPRGSALDTVKEKFASMSQELTQGMTKEALASLHDKITNDALASLHFQEILIPVLSILFGIIWGLIIFNIDRFIVTSTGKGDGTEKITWQELKGAIPRIIMGAIIAITISKPIEIRMFQTEINAALHEEQLSLKKDYEIRTRRNFADRIKDLENDNSVIQYRVDDYLRKITVKDSLYNIETSSGQAGRVKGEGPVAIALKNERDRLKDELDNFTDQNKTRIDAIDANRKKIYAELDAALSLDQKVASGLDGLVERIKLSHKVSSDKHADGTYGFPWISLFITLLFLAIELTPVFFKLMLTKTPYDYLAENRDELIKAECGIEVRYDYYKDKKEQERHLIINHEAERMIYEKIKVTDIQKELTAYAIEKYKEREKDKIDETLYDYIQSLDKSKNDMEWQNNIEIPIKTQNRIYLFVAVVIIIILILILIFK
jgi:hypothetical protein